MSAFYDVSFTMNVDGRRKNGVSRVWASSGIDAAVLAMQAEVRYMPKAEVKDIIENCFHNTENIIGCQLDDSDIVYEIGKIIKLKQYEVDVDGTKAKVLLPEMGARCLASIFKGATYFVR